MKTLLMLLSIISISFGTITVGVNEFYPHVIIAGNSLEGFDIDILKYIADDIDEEFEFDLVSDFDSLLNQTEFDIKAAGITITYDREVKYDFTHSYMTSNLGILEQKKDNIFNVTILLIKRVWKGAAILAIFLLIGALFTWSAELGNDSFADNKHGLFDAIYYTNTTATSTGYGDHTPKSKFGKIISMCLQWVGIAMIFPYMATQMDYVKETVINMRVDKSITEIRDNTIATVANTTSDFVLNRYRYDYMTQPTLEECVEMLEDNKVDMVIYDKTPLENYTDNYMLSNLDIIQNYGFIINDNALRDRVNIALLKLIESGEYERIRNKWFN